MVPKVGDKAPEFEAPDQNLKVRKLSDFRGSNLVLAFFPGAFTSVCTKELCTFRDSMANLNKLDAKVLGVSIDQPFSNAKFAKDNNLNFDLISDLSRDMSRNYGGLHENFVNIPGLSASKRSVFIVDKNGKIAYAWVSEDPGVEPDYRKVEEELSKIE